MCVEKSLYGKPKYSYLKDGKLSPARFDGLFLWGFGAEGDSYVWTTFFFFFFWTSLVQQQKDARGI